MAADNFLEFKCKNASDDEISGVEYKSAFARGMGQRVRQTGVTILADRHTRELIIAFTAIVLVWSIAGGLTFASAFLFGRGASPSDGSTAMIGDWLAHEVASR